MAVQAGKVGLWELDLATGRAWRTLQHDQIFGYDALLPTWGREEALRHVVPEDQPIFERAFETAFATGHFHYELRIQPSGRPLRWIEADGELLRDSAGQPVRMRGTVVDVTERRDLLERTTRSERLAAVATLVRGMSHELNNPLASVITNLDFVSEQLVLVPPSDRRAPEEATREELEEALGDAVQSAGRIKEILRDLNSFLPRATHAERHGSPAEAMRRALTLARHELVPCAEVAVEVPRDLPEVALSEEELIQVFASLLVNAGQATGRRTNRVRVTARQPTPDWVQVDIVDTGEGMTREVLAHVFEPFFTTKPVGRGKGLGVPACHGLLDSAGAELAYESAAGQGTTVRVRLPVATTRSA
jgi:signal transduction histidine kinase